MKNSIILLLFILTVKISVSQNTFLGKRLSSGISIDRIFDKTFLGINTELALTGKWSIGLGVNKTITHGKNYTFNTYFSSPDFSENLNLSGTYNANINQFSLHLNKFYISKGGAAPFGFYLCFIFKKEYVNIIRDNFTYKEQGSQNNPVYILDKLSPEKYKITSLGIGFGLNRILKEKIILGYLFDLTPPFYNTFPKHGISDLESIIYKDLNTKYSNRSFATLHLNIGYLLF